MTDYRLPPLIRGRLIRRYKRFLADIELEDRQVITAHCPNSGSMKGCAVEGSTVYVSESRNPGRKLKYTWELVELAQTFIGINTQVPNRLVRLAVEAGLIPELSGYERIRSEVKTGDHTRLDLLLENSGSAGCYVEIKNCTLVENRRAMFPDAVTARGLKHLHELERLAGEGHRAVIFFLIQRTDGFCFTPAWHIDPAYGRALAEVSRKGVEIIARRADINTERIRISALVAVDLSLKSTPGY